MTQKEIYIQRKSDLNRTRDRYNEIIEPRETNPQRLWSYYQQLFSHHPTSDEREAFIACMLLLYFPLTLFEGKRCRNHFNSTLAKIFRVSSPAVSAWISEIRVRYDYNHRGLQYRTQMLYEKLITSENIKL